MNNKFTDETIELLVGWSKRQKGTVVFNCMTKESQKSYKEMLSVVGVTSAQEFLDCFTDYVVGHIAAGTLPPYTAWCCGMCCSSTLTEMIIESEKQVENQDRLLPAMVRKLKGLTVHWDKDLAVRCIEGLFKSGYQTYCKRRVERFTKLLGQ
jgi:hypothetical protein